MTHLRVTLFSCVLLAACTAGDSIASSTSSIVGGTNSDASEDAVVLVLMHVPERDTPAGAFYKRCTGTLLAPNVVLTARHCVTPGGPDAFACTDEGEQTPAGPPLDDDYVPSNVSVYVGANFPDPLDPTTLPRAARFVHDGATTLCDRDVALIVLEQPIAGARVAPIRLEGDVALGGDLVAVGWGRTPRSYFPDVRQRRALSVLDVGPSAAVRGGGQLGPREFLATAALCEGDSGGPAIDPSTGAVVGIAARIVSADPSEEVDACGDALSVYMNAADFADLVGEAFAIAGGAPLLEEAPQTPSADAGTPDASNADASVTAPPDAAGCSASGAPSALAAWPLALFALAALARRRT